ncbi:MAG: hypothetical protein J7M26_04860, partial [Armatimonadetes bacterium]|nr:hypothetical protein [Armatimonadota bacterium]
MPLFVAAFVAACLTQPHFTPPQTWAMYFASGPRIPLVGDANADGFCDLIGVYKPGEAIIDVALNGLGHKCLFHHAPRHHCMRGCRLACVGEFDGRPGADVALLSSTGKLRIFSSWQGKHYRTLHQWLDRSALGQARCMVAVRVQAGRAGGAARGDAGDEAGAPSSPDSTVLGLPGGHLVVVQAPEMKTGRRVMASPLTKLGGEILSLAAGDFDGDGAEDLVAAAGGRLWLIQGPLG